MGDPRERDEEAARRRTISSSIQSHELLPTGGPFCFLGWRNDQRPSCLSCSIRAMARRKRSSWWAVCGRRKRKRVSGGKPGALPSAGKQGERGRTAQSSDPRHLRAPPTSFHTGLALTWAYHLVRSTPSRPAVAPAAAALPFLDDTLPAPREPAVDRPDDDAAAAADRRETSAGRGGSG